MQQFTAFDGKTYDVSDAFGPIDPNAEGLSGEDLHRIEGRRATLDNIVRFLGGLTPAEALGDGATLDQVHGNAWEPDTCGCRLHFLFDHYATPEQRVHVAHAHHATRHCQHHQHLKDDHQAHHEEVLAENQHKNHAVAAVADHLGVPPHEITWSHDDDRRLTLKHPKLVKDKGLNAKLGALGRVVQLAQG